MSAHQVLTRRGLIAVAGGLAAAGPFITRIGHAQTDRTAAVGDPFQMLSEDHRKVEALFLQIQQTPASDAQQRRELLLQVKQALTAHGLAEENVLYPMLARQEEGVPKATELFTEHAAIKTYLFNLSQADPASDAWMDKLVEFSGYVKDHAADEELNVFPTVRASLSPEQIAMLGRQMRQEKQQMAMLR